MMYYRISKNEKKSIFWKKIAQVWAVTLKGILGSKGVKYFKKGGTNLRKCTGRLTSYISASLLFLVNYVQVNLSTNLVLEIIILKILKPVKWKG